ncbi:hypothetical protein J6590_008366 [Homalodisca vitripennis]|nr:hypothetical protein J6590_008366 [Homalodisca vitripennis]
MTKDRPPHSTQAGTCCDSRKCAVCCDVACRRSRGAVPGAYWSPTGNTPGQCRILRVVPRAPSLEPPKTNARLIANA